MHHFAAQVDRKFNEEFIADEEAILAKQRQQYANKKRNQTDQFFDKTKKRFRLLGIALFLMGATGLAIPLLLSHHHIEEDGLQYQFLYVIFEHEVFRAFFSPLGVDRLIARAIPQSDRLAGFVPRDAREMSRVITSAMEEMEATAKEQEKDKNEQEQQQQQEKEGSSNKEEHKGEDNAKPQQQQQSIKKLFSDPSAKAAEARAAEKAVAAFVADLRGQSTPPALTQGWTKERATLEGATKLVKAYFADMRAALSEQAVKVGICG